MKKSNYLLAIALGASTLTYAQVGIGTSSPSNALDIETTGPAVDINDTGGGDPEINFQISGTTTFSIGIDNSDSDKLKIGTTAPDASTSVTIDASQNVGIGNTSPTAKLDVDGSAIFNESGAAVDFKIEGDTDTELFYVDGSADRVGVGTATPASGLDVQTSLGLAHTTITSATTLNQTHNVVLASDASGDFTITLPAAASNSGKVYYIKKTNSSENEITIDGNGAETVDGATTIVLYVQYDAIRILCDGSNWHIIADERKAHTCFLQRSSAQSISDATWTDVDLSTEDYDVGGIGDPTTNYRIDIKRAGRYQYSYSTTLSINNGDVVSAALKVNGTYVSYIQNTNAYATAAYICASRSGVVELSAGDYLELAIYHDRGSSANTLTPVQNYPFLSVTEIR